MVEGLEVTIKYRGAKYDHVASPATVSSEFAILKKDLAHLRVHSPSQKNVRRVGGSFVLHWPSAGTSLKVSGLADSLHTRWFKLCSEDPEALKLREFLSIESITLVQDGVLIRSTPGAEQATRDAPPGTLADRLREPISEVEPHPVLASQPVPTKVSSPRLPPTGPRSDRQPPSHLKRRMSDTEGSPNQTRQKVDVPEASSTTQTEIPDAQPQPQPQPPAAPDADADVDADADMQLSSSSPTPENVVIPPRPTQDDTATASSVVPAPAQRPAAAPTPPEPQPPPTPRDPGEAMLKGLPPTGPRPPSRPPLAPYRPASPVSSPGSDAHPRRRDRDRDVSRLTRELWDTRRHVTAMQARERVLLDDLERLGVRPEGVERNGSAAVVRDELTKVETELRAEKARRVRAERLLGEVERECRAPFVVPALFQAFMSISELSN